MTDTIIAAGPLDIPVRDKARLGCWAQKLYEKVQRKPLDLYYGKSGWCPTSLPRCVKRADFDELINSGFVRIELGRLVPNAAVTGDAPPYGAASSERSERG